ncbi:MAG: class I SAM-dependent methyltransferase [Parcubacteria group bacterium]|nr:class I SAM-dependent methyltransferase [Parcubacteria group bacterium]
MFDRLSRIIAAGYRVRHPSEYSFWYLWGNLSFPHRPTRREIGIYRDFIGEDAREEANVLILGATPELRDCAAELRIKPMLVDRSYDMLFGMLRFAEEAVPENETWLKGDWLAVPLPERHFDVVVGDLSLRQLAPERQGGLLGRIAQLLRPGGKLILRHHNIDPLYRAKPYEEIFEEMQDFPYEQKKYEAISILLSRLLDRSTQRYQTCTKEIVTAVNNYLRSGRPPFAYRLFLLEFLAKRAQGLIPLASRTREENEMLLAERFSIASARSDGSYPESEFYPVYLLRPRL